MKQKIFISYSHIDESFRLELETHLALLKRKDVIETWSDRKIIPGEKWGTEIDNNLNESNIILFLISADFIASDYCYDIEASAAIAMHAQGRATLIPIIIRPTDWQESPFGIHQALPKDAKAITNWQNRDEAWLNVIAGLKKALSKPLPLTLLNSAHTTEIEKVRFSHKHTQWLEDTEIKFSNGANGNHIKLQDIFVFPDIKLLTEAIDKLATIVSSEVVCDDLGSYLIFGDEQSGKTSLAKTIIHKLKQKNEHAIYLNGGDITSSLIEKFIEDAAAKQFQGIPGRFLETPTLKTLVIDNYQDCRLNKKFQKILLKSMEDVFDRVIILASDSFQFISSEIPEFDTFKKYEILRFGNVRRAELAEKWLKIGKEEHITESELYNGIDALKLHLDTFVKRNVVPSKPVYLISILQANEMLSTQAVELTSSGHCYQFLIYRLFERAQIKRSDVDTLVNLLTELAGYMLAGNSRELDRDLKDFFAVYAEKYISVKGDKLISTLIAAGILAEKEDKVCFRHKYIYYFYAGKYLADSLAKDPQYKPQIDKLISNLHRIECANVIIFLTHHTKDPRVLDEVQASMNRLFVEHPVAKLEPKELDFMKDFLDKIPQLVIEQRDIEQERRATNHQSDRAEKLEAEADANADKLDPTEILAQINQTFKGIEIIGQIVRNRHGSLERKTLVSLVESAMNSGLRFLRFFLVLSDKSKEEIVRSISYMLKENPEIDNTTLEKEAKKLFLLMTYGVTYGVLRKVAFSIGSKEAYEVYDIILKSNPIPSIRLINEAIELQFLKKIDVKSLQDLSDEFDGNVVCHRILKEIVTQHLYMHHVEFRDKQRISEVLSIPMKSQRLIQSRAHLET